MGNISADITIDYVNKRIYIDTNTATGCWYTVNELYSYLQDTFDELDQMDDPIPMTAQTPTDYTLVNGWFIDDETFHYLYYGAVKTSGWGSGIIRAMSYDTSAGTAFAANQSDVGSTITQGSFTGTILYYDQRYGSTDTGVVWIRPTAGTDAFTDTGVFTTTGTGQGSLDSTFFNQTYTSGNSGEYLYANLYTLGTIQQDQSQQIYIVQNDSTLSSWWPPAADILDTENPQHIDVLVKVKEVGEFIDSGNVTVYLRHYPTSGTQAGDLYDHFAIDISPGGRNAVPLATSNDLSNLSWATAIAANYSSVSINFVNGTVTHANPSAGPGFTNYEQVTWTGNTDGGIMLLDSSNTLTLGNVQGTAPTTNDSLWGVTSNTRVNITAPMTATYTMNKAFDLSSPNPYTVIVDCNGKSIQGVYQYFKYVTREGSTFKTYPITRASGGALSHAAQDGEQYIRAYVDNQTSSNSFSPVKASPFGTFAGGTLFAAPGVWLENMRSDDVQAFQLVDSSGTNQYPPNKQVISVSNVQENDRVTVFQTAAVGSSSINKQMYSSTTYNVANASVFIVSTAIAVDTPTTGILRIVDNTDSLEERYKYSAFSGSTFSLDTSYSLDSLTKSYADTSDTVYVPYIDQQVPAAVTTASVTVIFTAQRGLLVRVRRKTATAILPFESPGTFTSTGFTIATIRTPDTIVT